MGSVVRWKRPGCVAGPEIATLATARRRCCLMYNFRVRGYRGAMSAKGREAE